MSQPTLPPELIALVDEGHGVAEVYDPATNRTFHVVEQTKPHPCEHPETVEEMRALLDEARADVAAGRVSTRSTEELLADFRRRHGDS